MRSHELRDAFLNYFVAQSHTLVPSAALIPQKDPSLLFTNAGMVQFKNVFTGEEKRNYTRAVSSQKCMRVGGKHNDLENVGWTSRHHTFFEMLGNFSFGDYFKAEAVAFAWELLTKQFRLPIDRLWITVYEEDDEAEKLWRKIGVASDRIVKMGEETNYWSMGDTGPCGPCSEIHYDQGEDVVSKEHRVNCQGLDCECDRYLEIWNLVFMQYNRDSDGKLSPLPRPSIDTGMGLERLAAVMQGVQSDYQTDLFQPLLEATARSAGLEEKELENSMAGRVIVDHLRGITFLINDGILPSNEGRGYVLRRIIRRAARYGREIGLDQPFLYQLTGEVVDLMKQSYPELVKTRNTTAEVTKGEEERFIETLNQGLGLWREVMTKIRKSGNQEIPGKEAFRLYDTYGFPFDLSKDMAREEGLTIDEAGFQEAMQGQKEKARKSWVIKETVPYYQEALTRFGNTVFVGYEKLEEEVRVIGILKEGKPTQRASKGEVVELVFDQTPFYGESGGQVGDQGLLEHPNALMEVHTTLKPVQQLFIHQGRVAQGEIVEGETYRAVVNPNARIGTARNHTATHILHAVLREVLGEHVKQAGSLVTPGRLRFDFSHFKALRSDELHRIEELVNEWIRTDPSVDTREMSFQDAIRTGALAFFDDKYGDRVRVVKISDFSKELCGGTHCRNTGQIGLFKLVQETSVAAGMRRVEAITGEFAFNYIHQQETDLREVASLLKVQPREVVEKTRKVLDLFRKNEKELERLKNRDTSQKARKISDGDRLEVLGISIVRKSFDNMEMKDLRIAADSIKSDLGSGVAILGSTTADIANLIVVVTKDKEQEVQADLIIKELAPLIGGKGGGRPGSAQAGGKKKEGLAEALGESKVREAVEKAIKKQ